MGNVHCMKTEYKRGPIKPRGCSQSLIMSGGAIPMSDRDISALNIITSLKNPFVPLTAVSLQPEQIPAFLEGISPDTPIPHIHLTPYNLVIHNDNISKCYNEKTHTVFVNGMWVSLPGDTPFDNSRVSRLFPIDLLPPVPTSSP